MVNESSDAKPGALETRAQALFEDSVERLDARTRSRLTQAHHAALDELRRTRVAPARWLWAPIGGIAAVAAAILLVGRLGTGLVHPGAAPLEELEAAGVESVELLEDVEFYAWLAEQERSAPGADNG